MKKPRVYASLLAAGVGLMATLAHADVTVNSLSDATNPPPGTVTLRAALAQAGSGEPIVFDAGLDGGVITLSIVGEEHSTLIGEVLEFDEANNITVFIGYRERDYGRSALYSTRNVVIDATALPNGITIEWGGGDGDPARVLAVYGDLTMRNVDVRGGRVVATALPESTAPYAQLSTRARGGGLAVWGVATLEHCRLYDNACVMPWGTPARDRDAGVFGGGIYANVVDISDGVISGNLLSGAGVAGGGVFTVGGADGEPAEVSTIERTTVSGNHIEGLFAYGGGVYSDGGGIGELKTLLLQNCTIAENRVAFTAPLSFGYWRGGGVYISNGHLTVRDCTIVFNQTHGVPRTDELDKPNLAGGIAATIGNAHAVENMSIGRSIIAGNTVHPFGGSAYDQDIFSGSLLFFISEGYNRVGVMDFSQILVPVGELGWETLIRKFYPKEGDLDGRNVTNLVDLAVGPERSADIISMGVNTSNAVPLYYPPHFDAVDQAPAAAYSLSRTYGTYAYGSTTDGFLESLLSRVEALYGPTNFAATFTADFDAFLQNVDLDPDTAGNQPYAYNGSPILSLPSAVWYGPNNTWPAQTYNHPYIEFWHQLDRALEARNPPGMGPELIGEDAWLDLFDAGPLQENTAISMAFRVQAYDSIPPAMDQMGAARPRDGLNDIGAVERPLPPAPPPAFAGLTVAGSNLLIRWVGATNRSYRIMASPTMNAAAWNPVVSNLVSPGTVTTNALPTRANAQFFRLDLEEN